MATMADVNAAYSEYRDRFYRLQSRGAGRKWPVEMDRIRAKLNSIERAWPAYMGKPDRLLDVVVSEGIELQKTMDRIESDFPPGTRVAPGSTGEETRLNIEDLPATSKEELERNAPKGFGEANKDKLLRGPGGKWYYFGGFDARWILGVLGGLGFVEYLRRSGRGR